MKSWIALLPVVALILSVTAGCERKESTSQEYSRANQGTPGAATSAPERANEPATRPAPTPAERAAANPSASGRIGAEEEAAGGMQGQAGSQQRTLTGKLNVQDEDARTFVIEGNAQTYVAPQQIDLVSLDGEQVTVRLDENGRVQTIETIAAADRES